MLTPEEAVQGFAAVASEPRLEVLLTLVRAGNDGLSVGEIQERVDLPASTLATKLAGNLLALRTRRVACEAHQVISAPASTAAS